MKYVLHNYQTRILEEAAGFTKIELARNLDYPSKTPAESIIKVATGGGKTLLTAEIIKEVGSYTQTFVNGEFKNYGEVVFVVVAPNSLHRQHFKSLETYGVTPANGFRLLTAGDLLSGSNEVTENDVIVLNWASVNSKDNKLRSSGELENSIEEIFEELRSRDIQIVLFQDEAHHTASGKGAQAVREAIKPTVIINTTATPDGVPGAGNLFEAKHSEVVASGSIVKRVIVEDTDAADFEKEYALKHPQRRFSKLPENDRHIYSAIRKSQLMDEWYEESGSKVKTVTGIQLPVARTSGEPTKGELEKDSKDEQEALTEALKLIEECFGWTIEGGEVAVWLSGDRRGFEGNEESIKGSDSPIKVLIFKFAIAVGYDLPRMKTGALLLDSKTKPFAIQTVGRFIRQPEQKQYLDERLNQAYLYTSKSLLREIVQKSDDTVIFPPLDDPLREDIQSNIELLMEMRQFGFPNWYSKNTQKGTISTFSLREAIESVFKEEYKAEAYPQIPKTFLEPFGFSWSLWKSRSQHSSSVSNIDEGEVTQSHVFELNVDSQQVDSAYAELRHDEFSEHTYATADNFDAALGSFLRDTYRKSFSFEIFKRLSLADDINKNSYRALVQKVLSQVQKTAPVTTRTWIPQASDEDWVVPDSVKVAVDEKEEPLAKMDVNYLYSLGRPLHFESGAEHDFASLVIPKIRLQVRESGGEFIGYFKAGTRHKKWLAIPYEVEGQIELFYLDWVILYRNLKGELSYLLIETKKQKGQAVDAKAGLKASALSSWLEEQWKTVPQRRLNGCVINLIDFKLNTAEDNITLMGEEVFFYPWLDSVLKD